MFNDNAIMITQRQRNAVKFCEEWLEIRFEGDIENFYDVSDFLSLHLEDAKDLFNDAISSYYSFIADKDWA